VIIDTEPMMINSTILPTPVIDMSNGRTQACSDNTLRNLPIKKPSEALTRNKWAIVYESKHYN
jgi:hypothetical protein